MDELRLRELEGAILSRTLVPASRTQVATNTTVLGFDTEFIPRERRILSVQFAGLLEAQLVSRVYEPPAGGTLNVESLVGLVRQFCREVGIEPLAVRGVRRVALVAHFAQAELGMVDDVLRDANVRQLGKATSATLDPFAFPDEKGRWHVRIIDLFGYLPTSLRAIGKTVALEKLEVDVVELAELKRTNRAAFEAYGARDAEIAVRAFSKLRSAVLADFGVDILLRPSLASTAGGIFRARYLTSGPQSSFGLSEQIWDRLRKPTGKGV